jgi:hypothetical protein
MDTVQSTYQQIEATSRSNAHCCCKDIVRAAFGDSSTLTRKSFTHANMVAVKQRVKIALEQAGMKDLREDVIAWEVGCRKDIITKGTDCTCYPEHKASRAI